METIAALMSWTFTVFNLPFTLYVFTFSLWEVFIFGAVSCIAGKILAEVFLGD